MVNNSLQLHTFILLLFLFLIRPVSAAEKLTLAVASNFNLAMQALSLAYKAEHTTELQISFASSGKLYAQIVNGAPYDVFLSADQAKPQALIALNLADKTSLFTYAQGRLALWSAKPNIVDSSGQVLHTKNFNKLALANPRLAPYGASAVNILETLNLISATKDRWVLGENISQTYQFVATENADIGFVALSQIMYQGTLKSGSAWIVPQHFYQAIKQDAVVINTTKNRSRAKEFLTFLQSPKAEKIMQDYGYHAGNKQ